MAVRAAASRILVVDDDPCACDIVTRTLQRDGHNCVIAQSGAEAFRITQQRPFDLLVLDMRLPDTDGLRLLRALRDQGTEVPAVFITAHPSLPSAVEALGYEAYDYLPKPFRTEQLIAAVNNALRDDAGDGGEYLWQNLERTYGFRHVMSHNRRTREAYLTAAKVARSRAPVLICGESGTGKEFLARAIHHLSDRAAEAFVVLNCGAFPEDLLESELFGHEKGAFTSAGTAKPGLCEIADGGTLFLDEVGDMSAPMQVKLLRFLQDGSFRRLGGTKEQSVSVRIVAATNQDLQRAIAEGRFREDLYWRISVVPLHLPPLRERPEDIEPLSRYFVAEFARQLDRERLELSDGALDRLRACSWPGNIRQLHNVLLRASLLAGAGVVKEGHVGV